MKETGQKKAAHGVDKHECERPLAELFGPSLCMQLRYLLALLLAWSFPWQSQATPSLLSLCSNLLEGVVLFEWSHLETTVFI